ncbi:flagellar hook protein FlgE [Parahaliea mediterranea]|uniref:Flagellar hook protein FlgE n=1 Tax=Parahaliea mediterranea TaxID=651086 RepID=A0A939DE41_9GAMM|nr:flagellar hook protein FlgE [Parahaliea mediterranea]MBN7795847.1 flagellar hook protein FlgE [Parahaliea mediterranea]
MGFSQALSGLNAAATNLDVVGNNIANSQTVGFKGSGVQFSDVYAGTGAGLGTRVAGILQDFTEGNIDTTNRNLDLAVSGIGFFRFSQNNETVYSRNGQLILTKDGFLENAVGARLMGYPAGTGTGGQPVELNIPASGLPAQASTAVDAALNLDATAPGLNTAAFDHTDGDTYSYANTGTVYDSLGVQHSVTMYFVKDVANPNQWQVHVGIDGAAPTGPQTLEFDGNGALISGASATYNFAMTNGANALNFDLDFTGTTQFGRDFAMDDLKQDGYTAGSLVGISFDEAGNIVGNYSNEQSQVLGTIALANFRNPEGLKPVGDNAWAATGASGQELLGLAGTGLFGGIESGALESSNVDLTQELVDLIIAQRNYQANTQTIKVQDEVLQNAVNLR